MSFFGETSSLEVALHKYLFDDDAYQIIIDFQNNTKLPQISSVLIPLTNSSWFKYLDRNVCRLKALQLDIKMDYLSLKTYNFL